MLDSVGAVLATAQTHFDIHVAPGATVQGTVAAAAATVTAGQTQTCTAHVTNRGTDTVTNLAMQQLVTQLDLQHSIASQPFALTLAAQATQSMHHSLTTSGLTSGPYACVLQANRDGAWVTLAFAAFDVLPALNQPPIASAGTDRTAFVGATVVLDGSGSRGPDGDSLTYVWTLRSVPLGSTAVITQPTAVTPSLVPDRQGTYMLQLTVNDGHLDSLPAMVTVLVPNRPPVADAGRDQHTETGKPVTLQGTQSFDPDGDLLTYVWSLEWRADAIPAASALTDADLSRRTTPTPLFTPDVDGTYVVQLSVDDGQAVSAPAFVAVTATTPNVLPNAHAGPDQTAIEGSLVLLDGRLSSDADQGPQPLRFQWTFTQVPSGSTLTDSQIFTAQRAQASFVPDVPGVYLLRLHVFDGQDSASDAVQVTVADDVPPNARAGDDQTVLLGHAVHLDGSDSDDPDQGPQPLTFQWRFVALAPGSQLTPDSLRDARTARPSFTPDVVGAYVLELTVFDGVERVFDNVLVTVALPPLTFRNVTHLVHIATHAVRDTELPLKQRISTVEVRITNTSTIPIAMPIQAVFDISTARVMMPDAQRVSARRFVYDLVQQTGLQALAPGQAVQFTATFVRPHTVPVSYTIQVFGMVP
jgi:hypothetical protein